MVEQLDDRAAQIFNQRSAMADAIQASRASNPAYSAIYNQRMTQALAAQGYSPDDIKQILNEGTTATQPTSAQIAATAQQSAAQQQYKDPSWWQNALTALSTPFEWIEDKITTPLASIITAPFTGSTPGTEGMNWFARQRAEYDAWDAPSWDTGLNLPSWLGGGDFTLGAKGAAEMPLWLIPGAQVAKPVAAGAKVLKGLSGASALARTGRLAGTALEAGAKGVLAAEYAGAYPIAKPLSLLTRNKIKMLETPAQQLARMTAPKGAATVARSITDMPLAFAPEGEMALAALPHGTMNLGVKATKVKGIKQLAEAVFGRTATTTDDDLVRLAALDSMANAAKARSVTELHNRIIKNAGDIDKTFGLDEGAFAMSVKPLNDTTGKIIPLSNQFSDIIENPIKYNLNPAQKKVIDALRDAQQAVIDFGYEHGLYKSRDFFWHRKVKGIESGEEIVEKLKGSLKGQSGQMSRVYDSASEGARKGIVYDHPYKQLEEFQNAVIKAVANKRQVDLLTPLGRTAMDKMNPALYTELTMAKEGDKSAKILLAAIRRASRGEKLPGATMAKLRRDYPEIAKALEEATTMATKVTDKANPARKTAFSELIAAAQREVLNTGTSRMKLSHIQAEAMKWAKSPFMTNLTEEQVRALKGQINKTTGKAYKVGDLVPEATVQNKSLMGHIFPEPLAKKIDEVGAKEADQWLKTASKLSSVSRQTTATFDLSWATLQGLPIMGRNPYAWAKATLKQLDFVLHPERLDKFMTEHSQTIYDMIMSGSSIQRSEFTEAGGMIGKWAGTKATSTVGKKVKPVVGKINEQTLERANAAWTGASIASRVYMWEALAPRTAKTALGELARSLDRMAGVMNTAAMMYGPNSKEFMNAFGLFAHQYTGGSLSLIRDTLSGGLRGSEARKALGGMMASGMAMYFGVCKLTGQEPDLNPTSANFLTVNVGGKNVGIGSIYYGLARLGGNVLQATNDVAEGDKSVMDIIGFNKTDNPFVKFLYSRTAPLTGTALELMSGKNYFGEPFEGVADYVAYLGGKMTPFWMQSLTEGEFNPIASAAEIGGMRTYPKGEWERIKELREAYSQSDYGKRWDELNKLEQERVMSGHEDIAKLKADWNEGQIKKGNENALFWNEWDEINADYSNKIWAYQAAVDSGQMSLSEFRAAYQDAAQAKGAQQDYLKAMPQYAKVVEKWTDPKQQPDYAGDIAYDEYVSTMYDNLTDQYGIYNYEERQRREAAFKSKWGDDMYAYVMDRLREGKDEPPLLQEYRRVQEMLRPYWNVKDQLIELANSPDLEELDKLATEVGKTNPDLEQQMRSGKAIRLADGSVIRCTALSRLQRQIEMIRRYKRTNNPELNEALSLWYA